MSTSENLLAKLAELDQARSEAEAKVKAREDEINAEIDRIRAEGADEAKTNIDHLGAIRREIRDTMAAFNRQVGGGPVGGGNGRQRAPRGSLASVPTGTADQVVAFLGENGPAKSKTIRDGIALDEAVPAGKWSAFLTELAESGTVSREGERAATKYSVA